jgi:hypothetical protein
MRIRKVYGESKIENCMICGKHALSLNAQGFPVCNAHKSAIMPELKCLCGEYLMMMDGKFGKFFQCINCGNINMKKAIEMNEELIQKTNNIRQNNKQEHQTYNANDNTRKSTAVYVHEEKNPADKIIRSDDPDYFD